MKKIITAFTIMASVIGYAQTFVANGITYEVISGTNNVSAKSYNIASGSQVTIPSTVLYETKSITLQYSVTEIGVEAFRSKGLTSLQLSEGLENIGDRAFFKNSISGTLIIPNSLIRVGYNAFNSNSISSLDLGAGVQVLNNGAFARNNLTSLLIPSNVTKVSFGSFGDNSITTVTIEDGVDILGNHIFWNNPLTTVICNSIIPPTINTTGGQDDTFKTTASGTGRPNIDLTIPSGTMGAYVTDQGAKWTGFKSVTENPTITSVEEKVAIEELSVYPNPASTSLTIDLVHEVSEVNVMDVLGNSVGTFVPSDNRIDISTLSAGVYVVQVQVAGNVLSKKVIKK